MTINRKMFIISVPLICSTCTCLDVAQVDSLLQIKFYCKWNASSISAYWSAVPANALNGCPPRQCPVVPAIQNAVANVVEGTAGLFYKSTVTFTCSPTFAFFALGTLQQKVQCAFNAQVSFAHQMYWNVSEAACSGSMLILLLILTITIVKLNQLLENTIWIYITATNLQLYCDLLNIWS